MQAQLARVRRDQQGYLRQPSDWTPELATELAEEESISLSDAHWEILDILRDFHQRFEITPTTRVLVKTVREALGEKQGTSMYLMKLFPGGAVKQGCKIAGLPRPSQCF